jgi:hypothetical protein
MLGKKNLRALHFTGKIGPDASPPQQKLLIDLLMAFDA